MRKTGLTFLLAALLTAGLVTACGQSQEHQQSQQTTGYNHDDDHGQATAARKASDVTADFKFASGTPQGDTDEALTIQVNDKSGKPINEFDISHEKKMHLIVVKKDLSYYAHLHPEYKGNGQFTVTTHFPMGGDYKLFADFVPTGGEDVVIGKPVQVEGIHSHLMQAVIPDKTFAKTVDGTSVKLSFDQPLAQNKPVMLTYHFEDAATQKPITNLQPYLGAIGHVVILSEDLENYLHVHPMDEKGSGPDAIFHTEFPHSGIYKIFGEFQRDGKVFTVPFVVQVS